MELTTIGEHIDAAEAAFKAELNRARDALNRARELGVVDQLAVATKALRTIEYSANSGALARSMAKSALKKMEG